MMLNKLKEIENRCKAMGEKESTWKGYVDLTEHSVRLDSTESCVHVSSFTFSFFFLPAFVDSGRQHLLLWTVYALFMHCAYTVYVLKKY